MYKYHFHIIDREFDDEYDYQGYFDDHMEADRFITDNERVGNTIVMVAPLSSGLPRMIAPLATTEAEKSASFLLGKFFVQNDE